MGPRSQLLRRVALTVSLPLVAVWVSTGPTVGQADAICGALSSEALQAAVPGAYDEPMSFPGGCQWHGTSAGGGSVDLMLVSTGGTADDYADAGGQASTIGGFPAMSMSDATSDPPSAGVVVDLGGDVVLLTLSSDGPGLDLEGAVSQLAASAVPVLAEAAASGLGEGGDSAGDSGATLDDPCALFTADELSELFGSAPEPVSDGRSCHWDAADSGTSVSAGFDDAGMAAMRRQFPGGEDIVVANQPAYQVDQSVAGLGASQVVVDVGPERLSLLVTATDPSVDVAALARELIALASGGGLPVSPGSAEATGPCQLATPAEVATAAGVDVKLKLQDYEVACNYEGGRGNKHVAIYVQTQDPATFDEMIASVAAIEVDGPGESNWWWSDYASLFSRQGDLVLQVAIQSGKKMPEARLQVMAAAVMETLLAP